MKTFAKSRRAHHTRDTYVSERRGSLPAHLHGLKIDDPSLTDEEREHLCATKIQSRWRGKNTRVSFDTLRKKTRSKSTNSPDMLRLGPNKGKLKMKDMRVVSTQPRPINIAPSGGRGTRNAKYGTVSMRVYTQPPLVRSRASVRVAEVVLLTTAVWFLLLSSLLSAAVAVLEFYLVFYTNNRSCPHERLWFLVSACLFVASTLTYAVQGVAAGVARGRREHDEAYVTAGRLKLMLQGAGIAWFIYGCVLFLPHSAEAHQGDCRLMHNVGQFLTVLPLALCLCAWCCACGMYCYVASAAKARAHDEPTFKLDV